MSDILSVENLCRDYKVRDARGRGKLFRAVDSVSFDIERGSCFGLVGESGSGKTTIGRTVIRLLQPTSGRIIFDGADITKADMKAYRKRMQIIFQNPAGSLDPKYQIGDIVCEGMKANRMFEDRAKRRQRAAELLEAVGLSKSDLSRYPGEFSGGQQQRIGIARALAVEPEFLVCDEPVSALDVSLQAQILNLLMRLKSERSLSFLFISHDMSVVRHMSDRIGVLFGGRLMECGSCDEVISHPAHPYTKALIAAIPSLDPQTAAKRIIRPVKSYEEAASGQGCVYAARCTRAMDICKKVAPAPVSIGNDHILSCHLFG